MLANTLPASDGRDVLRAWRQIAINRYPAVGTAARLWELRNVLTPYDAAYAALAEVLGCPVVTADRRLAGAPGIRCEVVVVPR